MTTSDATAHARLRSLALVVTAVLTVAAVVLTVLVWRAVASGPTETADVGDKVPLRSAPYGRELTVLLPGSEVTVLVGAPVDRIDHELLDVAYDDPDFDDRDDLGAPDDGSLVPVTWHVRAVGGFLRKEDPTPIAIRLVAADRRVDLDSVVLGDTSSSMDAADPRSVAVAVDGDLDAGDLAVEVEYAGVTQTAQVSSGEVDPGVAQSLYDDGRSFTAGCTEVVDRCALVAADPGSPVRPDSANFTVSHVTLYPYDAELGWADEGTLWAGVRLQLFGADSIRNAAGETWFAARQSAPVITLDGAEPVQREGLKAARYDTVGRVVFRVDADADPGTLTVRQVVSAGGSGAPGDLPLRARLHLKPVG